MADRSIMVRLRADISDLQSKMASAGKAVASVATSAEQTSAKGAGAFGRLGKGLDTGLSSVAKHQQSIKTLGNGFGLLGLAAAAGVGVAVKAAADFDAAMSGVAASGQDAKDNLGALREAAIQAGASTKYSATEAAGGIEALAKAGVSANDTLGGGLSGALSLAAAGNLDVASSAEVAASAMTQFGLSGAQVPHIADLLAAGAGKAQGEVSDLAGALSQAGLVAAQTGLGIEETTGTLAAFASAGLTGSDAGTALKTMLQSLTPNSAQAAAAMKRIGLEAYDAQGNFIGITAVAGQLRNGLSKLSVEQQNSTLKTIFGADAVRSASILYANGAKGIGGWIGKVNDSGFAAETAATKMDNLKGDIEQFGGSLETALIGVGEGGTSPLRMLVGDATDAVNAFNNLGQGAKSGLAEVGVGVAAFGLGASGIAGLAGKAVEARTAIKELGLSYKTVGLAAGGITAGLTIGAAVFAHYAVEAAESRQAVRDLADALQASNGVLDENIAHQRAASLEQSGALQAANDLGISIDDVTQASLGNAEAQARVNSELGRYTETGHGANAMQAGYVSSVGRGTVATEKQAKAAELLRTTIGSGNSQLADARDKYDRLTASTQSALKSTGTLTTAQKDAQSAYESTRAALVGLATPTATYSSTADMAATSIQDLAKSLFAQGDAFASTVDASSAYQAAIDAADKTLSGNSDHVNRNRTALRDNTGESRENVAALSQLASAGKSYVESLTSQGQSQAAVRDATKGVREQFVGAAHDAGLTRAAADKLADSYGLIPKEISTKFDALGLALQQQQVTDFQTALSKLSKPQQAKITAVYNRKGAAAAIAELDRLNGVTAAPRILTKSDAQVVARRATAFLGSIKNGAPAIKTKSDTAKVAAQARAFLASIKDVDPKVLTKKDLSAARAAKAYLDSVHDKPVTIHVGQVGASAAAAAISNAARDRTATIYTKHVSKGGQGTGGGRAGGGPIIGPGTGTSDEVDIKASNGEYMQTTAAHSYYGTAGMDAIRAMRVPKELLAGYKYGGAIGGLGFASGGAIDVPELRRLIAALEYPLHDVTIGTRDVAKERRDLAAARDDRRDADTKKERRKADAAVSKQAGQLKDAMKELSDAQHTFADQARQAGATLAEPYVSKSVDIDDIKESKRQGAADLTAFAKQIAQLRKLGLSETDVQDIVSKGAINGGEEAKQIIDGGKKTAAAMNRLTHNFELAADAIGLLVSRKPHRRAYGGIIAGDGTDRSDNVDLKASPGEFLTDAPNTRRNLGLLQHINAGKDPRHLIPSWQVSAASGSSVDQHIDRSIDVKFMGNVGMDPAMLANKMMMKIRDSQRSALYSSGLGSARL